VQTRKRPGFEDSSPPALSSVHGQILSDRSPE
jgi:hypothetical protein